MLRAKVSNCITEKIKKQGEYNKILSGLMEHDVLSKEELEKVQNEMLKKIIKHAYENSEYYKMSFDKVGVTPKDINKVDDLRKLPILKKQDIRENLDKICVKKKGEILHVEFTSGTKGMPLKVFRDIHSIRYEEAAINRIYNWAGYKSGDKIAHARVDDDYYNFITGKLYINPYSVMKNIETTINSMEKHNVKFLFCISSTAETLSSFLINKNRVIKLKAVITSSETLSPLLREKVKKAFGCSIFDYYGNTERVAMIANCECGEYHFLTDYGAQYFKHIEGNRYEVISTNLFNFSMPLINYATGDIVEIDEATSKCGRNYPVIKSILGREADYVIINNEKAFSTILTTIFNGIQDNNISASQFVQSDDNNLKLNLKVNDENNVSGIKTIKENFYKYFKRDIEIVMNEDFILSKSGKSRFIVRAGEE